jgi:hypothetical protein
MQVTERFVIMFTQNGRPLFECMLYDPKDKTYTPVPIPKEGLRAERAQGSHAWEAYQLLRSLKETKLGG